ncbi:MAG TPA: methyl-accepting chemotaxis protein [Rhodocyclaceae bacterium]|nr:methyl-accepting chemotaxis protein [Rhodocyclaceae bacterium]
MLDRLSLKLKLLVLSGLAITALTAAVISGFVGIHSGVRGAEVLGRQVMPSVLALQKLKELQIAQRSSTYETGLWENDPEAQDQFADIAKEKQAQWQKIDAVWKGYSALPKSEAEGELWKKFEPEWQAWRKIDEQIIELVNSLAANKDFAAQKNLFQKYYMLGGQQRQHYIAAEKALNQVVEYNAQTASTETQDVEFSTLLAQRVMLGFGIPSVLVVGILAFLITRNILHQMGGEPAQARDVARRIASGDLTAAIPVAAGDDSSLMATLSEMQNQLRSLISQVLQSADELFTNAKGLSSDVQVVLGSAEAEGRAAGETATAVDTIARHVTQVGESAETARSLSEQAGKHSTEGREVVTQATIEMGRVSDAVRDSSTLIKKLGDYSNQISSIANVIREIADQTNLLALNAAIEAARAGESGRGFAVVADEVRQLSERTAQSTGEITATISNIQRGVAEAVQSMAGAEERVSSGVTMVQETTVKMESIHEGAEEASAAVAQITQSLLEGNRNLLEIERQMSNIVAMVNNNITSVGAMARSTQNINDSAQRLTTSVRQFRL